jgi:hypothetical protein
MVTAAATSRIERHEHYYAALMSRLRFHSAWTNVYQAAPGEPRHVRPAAALIPMTHGGNRRRTDPQTLAQPRGVAAVFPRAIDHIVHRVAFERGTHSARRARPLGRQTPSPDVPGRPALSALRLRSGLGREIGSAAEGQSRAGADAFRRLAARAPQSTPAASPNGAEAIPRSAPSTLVWRRPATQAGPGESALPTRTSSQPSPAALQSIRPHAPGHPSAPSSERGANALPAPASAGQPSPTSSLPFDNGTLDRLAADVMKRIDKRIRVERERRGR